ncbi:hypothetical protein PVAG01_05908 [Phlyctema vagabunda]|uniref:GDP-mannose transporter n=1 Tax=Phlyctema vagabunda TaxID=108571 RepID=A0ABR4PEI6_9HELO
MFSPRNTDSPNPSRPALQYLLSGQPRTTGHRPSSSLDSEGEAGAVSMSTSRKDSSDYRANTIPLITLSRSPSPFLRRRSDSNPTDTDEDEEFRNSDLRPFLSHTSDQGKRKGWKGYLQDGGLGQWLFLSPTGWSLYVGILVLWLGGCGIGLTIMNRIILWTGVYKFPYPLTTTFIEMLLTHGLLLAAASLTRLASPWLLGAGFSGMIAPSYPLQSASSPVGYRGQGKKHGFLATLKKWTSSSSGGIAGGGLFEFDVQVARQVLPLAFIFVGKVILSNLSFAYAQLPIYILARVGIVPLSLIFTSVFGQSQHSVSTISSALTGTMTLLVAAARPHIRVTWESIVAGVFSSIFVALYPVQLQRTYKSLITSLIPQGELMGGFPGYANGPTDASGTREEARATWCLLHYTSLISIIVFFPILLISGELGNIRRNCYFLDVFFHWLMVTCGGLGSWAVFFGTVLLTKATSPLTTTFLFVPRAAFMLPIMAGFKMPTYSWVGILMCWASSAWFMAGRRKEGRSLERLR